MQRERITFEDWFQARSRAIHLLADTGLARPRQAWPPPWGVRIPRSAAEDEGFRLLTYLRQVQALEEG